MSGELPTGWAETTLGDIASWVSTTVDPRDHPDQGYFYVSLEDVRSGHGSHRVEEETLGREIGSTKLQFERGDVLYSKLRPYLRKAFVAERSGLSVTDLIPLRPSGGLEAKFLLHHLLGPRHLDYIEPLMAGINLPRLRKGDVLGMPLRLPPLNEQRRIVAKLDALQSHSRKARAALDAIPTLLDRFRQSVLAAAFRGDLTADWRAAHPDVEPASALLARIRVERKTRWIADYIDTMTGRARKRAEKKGKPWTEADEAKARKGYAKKAEERYEEPAPVDGEKEGLPELPEGWCWARFDDIGVIQLGRRRAPEYLALEVEREYLRVANVKSDALDFSDLNSMRWTPEDVEQFSLREDDILISEGQSLDRIGQSAMVTEEASGMLYQSTLNRLRVFKPDVDARYAQQVCLAWTANGQFQKSATITTNIAHLSLKNLRAVPFPLPPAAEQAAVARAVDQHLAMERTLAESVATTATTATRLDQSILAKAFRGELVPQDPNDEPAADLLARIQAER